jgi:transcriptional regulator with XRE-family HTH domain
MDSITLEVMTTVTTTTRIGPLLRSWRLRRRLSQMELALDAGVSTRHLSFVETGRSRPSEQMVLHLAEQLEVPLRERNDLLLAAGYAPHFRRRGLDDPELGPVKGALDRLLEAHEPFPALVVDRQFELVAANAALTPLLEGVAPHLLAPPVNTMRVALHPEGMAPRIENLGEWRAHLLSDVAREAQASGDPALQTLYDELAAYPGPKVEPHGHDVFVPMRLGGLSFLSTRTTFATAIDVTVSELAVEAFFPADEKTAAALRAPGW